jgi:16S rRNA (adenine1518-N6/adenine1519-N6)-dimethyltransferase
LNCASLTPPARRPECAVVTIQWEAAQRLCSRPGDDSWGASAAVLQAAGPAQIRRRLKPSSFYPRPSVDSAILQWRPERVMPPGFGQWCRRVFSARRKVLTRALRDAGLERDAAEAACKACSLDTSRRMEDLDTPELVALFGVSGQTPN